jgi:transcriptional regulator with PAS, ATPase and Fis domain
MWQDELAARPSIAKASVKRVVARFLVDCLIGRSAARQGKRVAGIEPSARDELARLARHGNVRRLQIEIDCIIAATRDGQRITAALVAARKKPQRN